MLNIYTGCFFLWGNISIYVLSYFYMTDKDMSYDFIFIVDLLLVLSNWLGYQVGTQLFENYRFQARNLILLGGLISLFGVFMCSFATNLGTFLVFYCLFNGIGCGMLYFIPLICAWEWFPERKGIVSGIIIGGYGFGSFIFSFLSTYLVNPNDEQPSIYDKKNDVTYFDEKVASRTPMMLRILAIIWLFHVLFGALTIRRPKIEISYDNTK